MSLGDRNCTFKLAFPKQFLIFCFKKQENFKEKLNNNKKKIKPFWKR